MIFEIDGFLGAVGDAHHKADIEGDGEEWSPVKARFGTTGNEKLLNILGVEYDEDDNTVYINCREM